MFSFTSWIASQYPLFTVLFETNPLDGKCDQRAKVTSQPVKVVYDAVSCKIFYNIRTPQNLKTWFVDGVILS